MFFTVVVPTYNRSRLLRRCLDSIKKQTFSDYEVLILDDCSTDDTSEVMRKYTEDIRFKYVKFDKNQGHGDKTIKIAQDSGKFSGEWVCVVADDEYWYNEYHLEFIFKVVQKNKNIDLIAVDMLFDYDGIVVGKRGSVEVGCSDVFRYENLSGEQKDILAGKSKVVFRKNFLMNSSFFDTSKQKMNDVVFEGDAAYALMYPSVNIVYVRGVYHVFGCEPTARRKYLDFYNFIVSMGMIASYYPNEFLLKLKAYYSEVSAPINAFFDWGSDALAEVLGMFFRDKNYSQALRDIALVYQKYYQNDLFSEYEQFNKGLLSWQERDEAISKSSNVVLYCDGNYRIEVEEFLRTLNKNILFVVDDCKVECCNFSDILKNESLVDLVFITSASPKTISKIMSKMQNIKGKFEVATLLTRDVSYKSGVLNWQYQENL